MNINLLDYIGNISNKDVCLKMLRSLNKQCSNLSDMKLACKINQEHKKDFRYFTSDYHELPNETDAIWMWVDSGIQNETGDIIYFQFGRSGSRWVGALVNTENGIVSYQSSKDDITYSLVSLESQKYISNAEEVVAESRKGYPERVNASQQKTAEFYQKLYDRLLIQTNWEMEELRSYINVLLSRLNSLIKKGIDCSEYLVYSIDKKSALVNTGLLDKFGKRILIVVDMYTKSELSYTGLHIMDSKSILYKNGFSKEDLKKNILRVRFYNKDVSELIFDGELDDFDLENWDRLTHCIKERRTRFPEELSSSSDEVLCSDMLRALELGINLSKYDSNYIKPIYNKKNDSISFVVPYHIGNNFQKKPELGIVVSKFSEESFWQVMTILDYSDVVFDVRTISLYEEQSF